MKHELGRLAGAVAVAVAISASMALLHGCAAPSGTAPALPPRQPEPPPVKVQEASPKDRAALHAELGAGYYERGRMDVAIEELTEAQNLDPTNPKIYNYFALVYTVLGENAKAEQNFQRALQLAPNDPDVRHNWGWFLCSNDRPKESIPNSRPRCAIRSTRRRRLRSPTPGAAAPPSATMRTRMPTIAARSPGRPRTRRRCTV
jgi:type IV pilus assembly protein PilF